MQKSEFTAMLLGVTSSFAPAQNSIALYRLGDEGMNHALLLDLRELTLAEMPQPATRYRGIPYRANWSCASWKLSMRLNIRFNEAISALEVVATINAFLQGDSTAPFPSKKLQTW